jgi:N-acetylglucosaminyl-diphospho-decaprenol L-rhamnosyltransferase
MSKYPTISVIIVSYNTCEMTCDCIASVLRQPHQFDQEVVVLDNHSTDGSADEIAKRFPSVKLIRSEDNLGFGKGNNVAVRHATGRLLLLLNPDTLILDNAIERLVAFSMRKPEAKIWGGKTLFADQSLNPASCWSFMSLWSLATGAVGLSSTFADSAFFNPEAYGGWDRSTEREVDLITGCFLLIERSFWDELGAFDEKFYIYAEEADLCFRAILMGARPTVTPLAQIVHYGGASEKVRAGKLVRLFSGKATFIHKHWSKPRSMAGIMLMKIHVLVRVVLFRLSGTLRGNAAHQTSAQEWLEIWNARKTWENGYS